jgi:F-type H+-transporting ATPase subunit gamma
VQEHLDEHTVRAVAMESTSGLGRGAMVRDAGGSIKVPVGEAVLGRLVNALVVGSRAARLCRERGIQPDVAVPMATHYAGVTGTAHRVASDLFRMLNERQVARVELVYATHGGQVLKVQRQKLLPFDLPSEKPRSSQFPPIINVRPRQLLDGMISEYMFTALENAAMQSFFSENCARFRTMEAAHQNIRKKSADLTTLAQRMRQEAVTSEILELISGVEALSSVPNAKHLSGA